MTERLVSRKFHIHNAEQFYESVSETANSIYYLFTGNHVPFTNDSAPPSPSDDPFTNEYDIFNKMIFGKHVTPNDISYMIKRIDWVSGTVYTSYDGSDPDIFNKNFYVSSLEAGSYHIFKCLDNNNGTASTQQPLRSETSESDNGYIKPVDGYHWKYMFSIPLSTYNKFVTNEFIPLTRNANVEANAIYGSIDVINVVSGGQNYNSYANGTFNEIAVTGNTELFAVDAPSSNNNFYKGCSFYISSGKGIGQIKTISDYIVTGDQKRVLLASPFDEMPDFSSRWEITPKITIYGDGDGAEARGLVNADASNTIYKIQVVNPGNGYTYAKATAIGNTGSIAQESQQANNAVLKVIISPKGGHGSNPINELDARYVGVSVKFSNTENGTIPINNDYRTIGILKNPLYANVELTFSSANGAFQDEEIVSQETSGAIGVCAFANSSVVRLTNVLGFFETGLEISGQTSLATANISAISTNFSTFDQRYTYQTTLTYGGSFGNIIEDEFVSQNPGAANESNGYVHSVNSSIITLTNVSRPFLISDINTDETMTGAQSLATAKINGVISPDLVKGSGEILYVENFSPINRDEAQSENFKIVLKF